jgi:hypothetical protein
LRILRIFISFSLPILLFSFFLIKPYLTRVKNPMTFLYVLCTRCTTVSKTYQNV